MTLEISQAWHNIDQIIRDEVALSVRQDSRIYEIVDNNIGRVAFPSHWYAVYFDVQLWSKNSLES